MAKKNVPALDYRTVFEVLPEGYIVFAANDPDFTVVAQNDVHEKASLSKRADVLNRPLLEAFPDSSDKFKKTGVSDVVESIRRVIATKQPDVMPVTKYDVKDDDGNWVVKYWNLVHHPVFDDDGNVMQVFQATNDITDEVETSYKLAETERQLERALSVGGIATWNWDLEEGKIYGDSNLAYLFGRDIKEVESGLPLEDFVAAIHPEDRKEAYNNIQKTIKEDVPFDMEYRTISRDGTVHWVIVRGKLERDGDGHATRFPGALIDITDRRVAENNLKFLVKASTVLAGSLDYQKTLQDTAALAVTEIADWCTIELIDEHGEPQQVAVAHKDPTKVEWARQLREAQGPPDMTQTTGLPQVLRSGESEMYSRIPDEMIVAAAKSDEELKILREVGMSAAIIVPIIVKKKVRGAITMISAEMKRHYTPLDLQMAEEVAKRASTAIENAIAYERSQKELAERKRLQAKLAVANDQLEARVQRRTKELEQTNLNLQRSNRELENFAYVASHDLQEPLRKIQAFSNLLEDEFGDKIGEGADYLKRMRSAAARMSALINDLLAFSRVTTKKEPLVEVPLGAIVKDVLSDIEDLTYRTKGTVTVDDLPNIVADATQMRQLFQNLIANALKFHRKDVAPVVKVRSSVLPNDEGYRFEVIDNGVGFDEKYLDRIFAVFQRLNGREEFEGTGIGLAVCRKIVERHGGTITAKSTPGKGSTFIITLPKLHDKKGEEL